MIRPIRVPMPVPGSPTYVRLPLGDGRTGLFAFWAVGKALAIEAPRPRQPSFFKKLTARQREVALLVAEGLHSPEIAERLNISPVTVGVHLQKVYRKLDIDGRVQLAMLVQRRRAT
jgi:DNA-binding NarL/FixJ family response regulator